MDGRKQALITNYFPVGHPGRTVGHTLEDNPPREALRSRLEVRGDGESYTAHLPGSRATYGRLDLHVEDGTPWIGYVETKARAQRSGVASQLYMAARRDHGEVFASSATQQAHSGDPGDTRYLTTDGASFVRGLIASNRMDPSWWKDPFA